MKIKAFATVIEACAEFFELCGRNDHARDLTEFVSALKRHARRDLPGFFTPHSRPSADSVWEQESSRLQVKHLAKAIESAGQLLTAAGVAAKGQELATVAKELSGHGHVPVHALIERVEAAQEEARTAAIAEFVRRLEAAQKNREQFEKIVVELSSKSADIVGPVAVGYVQGKAKYGSKPKALAAIRDKRFERARLFEKMGE